jgi:hypothetical protein
MGPMDLPSLKPAVIVIAQIASVSALAVKSA